MHFTRAHDDGDDDDNDCDNYDYQKCLYYEQWQLTVKNTKPLYKIANLGYAWPDQGRMQQVNVDQPQKVFN